MLCAQLTPVLLDALEPAPAYVLDQTWDFVAENAAHHRHRPAWGGLCAHRPRQWVRRAIQSLRMGVSEVRWCSTWKPSAEISSSRLR